MNITGIIAEYNPFHNGHAYQLSRARTETDADALIVVMSGNFVQRGAPALLDKFARAKMALWGGADLVLELPPLWAAASAEYFAEAGVSLLKQLGCVRTLCYGCETPDCALFSDICRIQRQPAYDTLLKGFLKEGANYAAARARAALSLLPEQDAAAAKELLRSPNNLLALEYQKAIRNTGAPLLTHPVLRKGADYHSAETASPFASASAIRGYLHENTPLPANDTAFPATAMPRSAFRTLLSYQSDYPFLYEEDCSQMLLYRLLQNAAEGFAGYADCTEGFSNKICRNLHEYTGFPEFCSLLKTKDVTYTRVSRILLHILLDIRKETSAYWRGHSHVPYARALGFRKESAWLLSYIKKHAAIPLLARAADAKKILSGKEETAFFQKHLFADAIYRGLAAQKGGKAMPDEFRQRIVIL